LSAPHVAKTATSVLSGSAGRVEREARAASAGPWVESFSRFGFIVRGLIYLIPGVLALRLAIDQTGAAITQTGAIAMVGHQPFGRVLLLAVALGLAGYAMWGVIRVVLDPQHRGHSPAGIIKRLGYLSSALAYMVLFIATVRLLVAPPGLAPHSQDWTIGFLAKPFGAWLVVIVGLFWIFGAGVAEIVRGWRGRFEKDLRFERMGHRERWLAIRLGRFGTVARGAVFTIIGILMVAVVALPAGRDPDSGLDGALLTLLRQPYGRILLAFAALGLIAFGVFSVLCARWMRMHVGAQRTLIQTFPSP